MIEYFSEHIRLEGNLFKSPMFMSFVIFIFTLKVLANYQKEKIQFFYKKSETLVHEFLAKT